MKENIVKQKSYNFALDVVKTYRYLTKEQREFVMSKQLLRSGTSVGANVEEALAAGSRKDFIYKMTIASKEARESLYWLRLLIDSGYLNSTRHEKLLIQSEEIVKILIAIVKNTSMDENKSN